MKDMIASRLLISLESSLRIPQTSPYHYRLRWYNAGIREVIHMCNMEKEQIECEHPEKLKGKPGECSQEQLKECHGDVKEHNCAVPENIE